MVEIALLSGIFSYLIFGLGISVGISSSTLAPAVLFYLASLILLLKKKGKEFLCQFKLLTSRKSSLFLLAVIVLAVLVNLIGALGPELGFDALWYHLTLPKIYLSNQRIVFVPGNLLYYSAMPKLAEMIYLAALFFKDEILAKLIHFSFGILSGMALFRLSSRYLDREKSLLAVLVYYSSLVVGWQSITAYVDLFRTFFEILALDLFLRWSESEEKRDLIESAIILGLAVTTKVLALGSLAIYLLIIAIKFRHNLIKVYWTGLTYSFFTFLIPLPWLVFSFFHTGDPFYPIFSDILDKSHQLTGFNLWRFLKDFWQIFLFGQDPTLPALIISLPILICCFKNWSRLNQKIKEVFYFCFFAYLVWYFLPRTGGGRFILPYLPAFSVLVAFSYSCLNQKLIKKVFLFFVVGISLINIAYRFAANRKYLPVIFGQESKIDFLKDNLNFEFGDFLDTDGFLKKTFKKNDLVLVAGIHNLYYLDFNFVHESWLEENPEINYLLVGNQAGEETKEYLKTEKSIYENSLTKVKLYRVE